MIVCEYQQWDLVSCGPLSPELNKSLIPLICMSLHTYIHTHTCTCTVHAYTQYMYVYVYIHAYSY